MSATESSAARPVVLVHGAHHGGWCYEKLAAQLRARGLRVFTPTLSGVAERVNDNGRAINLGSHIAEIADLLKFEDLNDVVLCGHSYGGMVIGGVADLIPERIGNLVFLDAVIPENGKSIADYVFPGEILLQVIELAGTFGGGIMAVCPPDSGTFFNVNAADRELVSRRCTPQPLATIIQKISLHSPTPRVPHRTYIRAKNFPLPALDQAHARAKSESGWDVFELDAGHDIMLDAPEALCEILAGLR